MEFSQLTTRAQIHRLRAVALAALAEYPIEVARVRVLEHGFNTTFRVDTSTGDKFALRIDVNRRKPIPALDAEMAWLTALSADTDIVVPTPLATRDGALHTPVHFAALDRTLNVAVMSWLPGRDLASPTPESLHELGRITAILHRHASGWTVPSGAEFPAIDSVMMDSTDRIRPGDEQVSPEQQAALVEALDHVEPLVAEMIDSDVRIPIHADLHGWNLKWLRGRMSVFDFDDAGIGVAAQDLAITSYYQRPDPALRAALLAGYQTVAPLPPFTHEQFEATIAARSLLLVNEVIAINTREIRDILPQFLDNTVLRLRAYLESGVFKADVPGVRSLP